MVKYKVLKINYLDENPYLNLLNILCIITYIKIKNLKVIVGTFQDFYGRGPTYGGSEQG